jgi:hypothetical protein
VLCVAGVFASITFVRTLVALIEDPRICRTIKSEGEYTEALYRQGIAGYSFVYFVSICAIITLFVAIKERHTKAFVPLLCTYGLMSYFVLKSNYVTALLVVVTCSVILLFVEIINRKKFGVILLLSALFVFAVVYHKDIISAFAFLIPKRIADVIVVNTNQSVLESIINEFMYDRLPTLEKSIEAFADNPFGGLVFNTKISFSNGHLEGFGQHSHIIDTFALYGTFLGVFNIIILSRPFKNNHGKLIKENISLTLAIAVAMIFVLLFNNSTDAIALALTIIYPLARDSCSHKDSVCRRRERHRR